MKIKILIVLFTSAFVFCLYAIEQINTRTFSMGEKFETVETLTDIELPDLIIECTMDPTVGGKCWKSKYENDDERYGMFLGCKFLGNPQTWCTGQIYRGE